MWVCTERFLQDREWRTNSIKKIRKPDSNTERSSELSCCISHLIFVIIGFILVMGTIFTTSALWSAVRYVALLAVFRSSGWKMLVLLAANYELCSVNAASSATVRYPSESCQVSEYCIYLLVFCFCSSDGVRDEVRLLVEGTEAMDEEVEHVWDVEGRWEGKVVRCGFGEKMMGEIKDILCVIFSNWGKWDCLGVGWFASTEGACPVHHNKSEMF